MLRALAEPSPVIDPQRDALAAHIGTQRRTERCFRHAAIYAAVAAAIFAGLKFWPIAKDVGRFSGASSAAASGDAWGGVAILLFVVVCGIAAFAGMLVVRTVGWWVQMRLSQYQRKVREKLAREAQSSFGPTDWHYTLPPATAEPAVVELPRDDPPPWEGRTRDDYVVRRRRRRRQMAVSADQVVGASEQALPAASRVDDASSLAVGGDCGDRSSKGVRRKRSRRGLRADEDGSASPVQ